VNVEFVPVEPDEGFHVNDQHNQRKYKKGDAESPQSVLINHPRRASCFFPVKQIQFIIVVGFCQLQESVSMAAPEGWRCGAYENAVCELIVFVYRAFSGP
jgi:hypothetical protein